jgi:2-keto-4-pentenoate hydratase/2-oxohepta-3-ene-1,7-dioic acid hydratase in catechol pathway
VYHRGPLKLVTYDRGGQRRLGAMLGEAVIDLPDLVGHPAFPTSMEGLVARNGGTVLQAAQAVLGRGDLSRRFAVDGARTLAPMLAGSLRHFQAFGSGSTAGGAGVVGTDLPSAWHDVPPFTVGDHRSLLGPDEDAPWPSSGGELDYSAEVACVIGRPGRDLSPADAGRAILGYTLAIGWTARDGIDDSPGRARALHLATSVGPLLVTADEIDPRMLSLTARVDGEVWSEGWVRDTRWTFPELVAHVSRSEGVLPGDVYLSGTFPGGCGADLGRRLQPGMTVEVAADGVGTLRARVGRPA